MAWPKPMLQPTPLTTPGILPQGQGGGLPSPQPVPGGITPGAATGGGRRPVPLQFQNWAGPGVHGGGGPTNEEQAAYLQQIHIAAGPGAPPAEPQGFRHGPGSAKMQRQLRRSRKAAARRNRFSKIPWGTGPLTGQGLVNARAKWTGESPLAGLGGARAGVVHAGRDNRPWAAGPTRQPSAPGWGQRAPSTGGRR